MEFTGCI